MIPEALEDGYVPLQVFVPLMDAIASGTGTQSVYLKLDWSSIKKTTADDPGFTEEEGNSNSGTDNNGKNPGDSGLNGGAGLSGGSSLTGGSSLNGGSGTERGAAA